MGLDQYAYVASRKGQREEFNETALFDPDSDSYVSGTVEEPQSIAYWRKHPNLQGWMEMLWQAKGMPGTGNTDADFNCIELELTWDDVDKLEKDIKAGVVASLDTKGFFFGNPSDEHYREHDLKFCSDAKAELFLGRKVFYNSSW